VSNKGDSTLRTAFPRYRPDGSFGTLKLREVAGAVSRVIVKKKKKSTRKKETREIVKSNQHK